MTAGQQRKLQRAAHLITAALLLAYVYLPASDQLEDVVRVAVVPLLALTGIAMWQAPRLRRVRRQRGERK